MIRSRAMVSRMMTRYREEGTIADTEIFFILDIYLCYIYYLYLPHFPLYSLLPNYF